MDIIDIIKEEYRLIKEKTYNIDDDVDFIYEYYFKEDIIKINNGDYDDIFKPKFSSSTIFSSEEAREAHKINPINIYINDKNNTNGYDFINKIIYLGIHKQALSIVVNYPSIESAVKSTGYDMIGKEFTESKIKGSIRHEMIHWLDDTFTNVFKKRKIFNPIENLRDYNKKNYIYFDKFEINALIGNIIEAKRSTSKNLWNKLTFDEMLDLTPALHTVKTIMNKIDKNKYKQWKKEVLTRMNRENLLGDNMKMS
jgi:hypothetical protein